MTGLADLLATGGLPIALGKQVEWLGALEELGRNAAVLSARIGELAQGEDIASPDGLLGFMRGRIDDSHVVAAFQSLGLASLRDKLARFDDILAALPDEVKCLMAPVGCCGEVRLPMKLLSLAETGATGALGFNLAVEAESHLACEAGALWPYRGDNVAPGLVRISIGGGLEAGGKGTIPFQSGPFESGEVTAGASAGVAAELMFFGRPSSPQAIFAGELVRMLPELPNPFALASVWDAASGGWFEGAVAAIDGHAEAQVALSLGRGIDLPNVLSGKIAITGSVSVRRKAGYVLSVRREGCAELGSLRLHVALSRNKSAASSWGLGLGLELDVVPLAGRVHAVLAEALGKWSAGLEDIKPYLHPGSWIRKELAGELGTFATELVKDDGLRMGLVEDFGLLLGTSQAEASSVAGLLRDRIADKLGAMAGLALGDAQAKAGEAVATITASLPALAGDETRATLEGALRGVLGRFQAALNDEIATISQTSAPQEVADALQSIGVRTADGVAAADTALAGLRDLIAHYDELFHASLAAAKDSAKQLVGAQLSFEESRESSLDMEVVATIDACTPEAEALYRSLLSGKLAAVQRLFDAGGKAPGFELDRDASSIRRFARVSRKTGFAFVGFGVELTASEVLSGEADLRLLANGEIAVVARGELTRSRQGPREGRSLSLFSATALLLAKAQDDGGAGREPRFQQATALGMTASHNDTSLKAGEVTGLLSSLAGAGLIAADRVKRASEIYKEWSLPGGSDARHPAGDIAVAMRMDSAGLQRLLALGRDIAADLARPGVGPTTRRVFETALEAMLHTGRISGRELDRRICQAREERYFAASKDLAERAMLLGYLQAERSQAGSDVMRRSAPIATAPRAAGPRMATLTNAMLAMNGMADMLQLMAQITDARPSRTEGDGGWTVSDYRDRELALAASTREWLRLGSEWIFWFKPEMSSATTAFLLALVSLATDRTVAQTVAGALGDPFFTITMVRQSGEPADRIPVAI